MCVKVVYGDQRSALARSIEALLAIPDQVTPRKHEDARLFGGNVVGSCRVLGEDVSIKER